MHDHIRDEISMLLGKIDKAHVSQGTEWINQEDQLSTNEQGRPTLHVYILNRPLEELLTGKTDDAVVESDVEPVSCEDSTTIPDILNQFSHSFPCPTRSRKQRHTILLVLAELALLGALTGVAVTIMIAQAPSASVTLIPVQKDIATTTSIGITLDKPDTARQEIQGRLLSSLTLTQTQTITATGIGHQEARTAYGSITFYNAQPSVQVVAAGMLMTGADGVSVVTDQNAVIAAAVFPTDGQMTVLAHATLPGYAGNIRAGDMYGPCCRLNVFVKNGIFQGGQDAHTFPMVTQMDINDTASTLKINLGTSIDAAFQAQIHSNETLIRPVSCSATVIADHEVGDETPQVNVTLKEMCTGEVYDTQSCEALIKQIVSKEATKQLGEHYIPVATIQSTITRVMLKEHGTVKLVVKGTEIWEYQFISAQIQSIKATLEGKSERQAKLILLKTPGVYMASISVKNGTSMPVDTNNIHVAVLETKF